MNSNQELVTLLRDNGQRLRRSKEWCERNAHWIKRMKLTIADAPDSIAAEIEKTLTPPPDENGQMQEGMQDTEQAKETLELTDTPQSPEDTKTETIEQIADDVAENIIKINPEAPSIETKHIVSNEKGVTLDNKLSLRDAAEYGKMTYNKLTKLVRKGEIKTVAGKTPKAKMILASEIDNYLESLK